MDVTAASVLPELVDDPVGRFTFLSMSYAVLLVGDILTRNAIQPWCEGVRATNKDIVFNKSSRTTLVRQSARHR
jgi:hypothetical protein